MRCTSYGYSLTSFTATGTTRSSLTGRDKLRQLICKCYFLTNSKQRSFQPVHELAVELARTLKMVLNTEALKKTKATQQMKDVGDFSARVATLEAAFACDKGLEGKTVLLFDDLFQSGATMNVAVRTLRSQGLVKSVYALVLTRTRN